MAWKDNSTFSRNMHWEAISHELLWKQFLITVKRKAYLRFFSAEKTYLRLVPLTNLPIKIGFRGMVTLGQPPHKIYVLVWYGGLMTTVLKIRFQM